MKAKLVFDLPSESEEFNNAVRGSEYSGMIDDMWNLLFRPRHKHMYHDKIINELLGENVSEDQETDAHRACHLLMDRLEIIYRDIKHSDD